MASYRPSRELRIAKPCSESWEAMSGSSCARHCVTCDRDVLNTATMTPAQIEGMLAKPGPLPCMRLVRLDDGALMTAQVVPQTSLLTRAVAVISTAVMMSASAAIAAKPKTQPMLQGKIVDQTGVPIPDVKIELRQGSQVIAQTTTNDAGTFSIVGSAGDFEVIAEMTGFETNDAGHVRLSDKSLELAKPIVLNVGMVEVGEVVSVPLKTRKAKTSPTPGPVTPTQR